MAKMTRERTVKEKRALKAEKREERKQAAAAAQSGEVAETTLSESADDEPLTGSPVAPAERAQLAAP